MFAADLVKHEPACLARSCPTSLLNHNPLSAATRIGKIIRKLSRAQATIHAGKPGGMTTTTTRRLSRRAELETSALKPTREDAGLSIAHPANATSRIDARLSKVY